MKKLCFVVEEYLFEIIDELSWRKRMSRSEFLRFLITQSLGKKTNSAADALINQKPGSLL